MKFSLCTNCMGRRAHLEKTLPHNLSIVSNFPEFEIVLLDYNSGDGLFEWVTGTFHRELMSGMLKFYRTEEPQGYVMTHAKNVVHLLARGSIVTNLDGDNFLTAPYLRFVQSVFDSGTPHSFVAFNGPGIGSRISLEKRSFLAAGGYDEDLGIGWGPDDFDLAYRLFHLGLRRISNMNTTLFGDAIEHPDEGRNELTPQQLPKKVTHRRNMQRILDNARAGRHIANAGRFWGEAIVRDWSGREFSIRARNGVLVLDGDEATRGASVAPAGQCSPEPK